MAAARGRFDATFELSVRASALAALDSLTELAVRLLGVRGAIVSVSEGFRQRPVARFGVEPAQEAALVEILEGFVF